MIVTQYIKSTTTKPINYKDYESVNVLKWKNSKWKALSPYYLKTDGNEKCLNSGNILFENFYQGLKVYDIVYENKVYASRFHVNKPKYLWWEFRPLNVEGDKLVSDGNIDYNVYFRWRDSLWNCNNPIRYPNKIHRRKNTQFALHLDKENNETRMDYLTTRKNVYVEEYTRLVKQTPEYTSLLDKLKNGKDIMICEIDVPSNKKKGEYGKNCDEDNICELSINKLELLLKDINEAFGHGLCLAYSLLLDIQV